MSRNSPSHFGVYNSGPNHRDKEVNQQSATETQDAKQRIDFAAAC
jgi:hypothetical protein